MHESTTLALLSSHRQINNNHFCGSLTMTRKIDYQLDQVNDRGMAFSYTQTPTLTSCF